jgi:perosamine synthetase
VGVQAGDYVFVPNVTFVASCNAVTYLGAEPILVDICPETWQMNEQIIINFLEENCTVKEGICIHTSTERRVSAIMPVHTLGNMCQMDSIIEISKKYNLMVVEDAAEALGATQFQENTQTIRHAGTFGHIGVLSFNGNKMITTGGGGMLLTDNEVFAQKARHLSRQAKTGIFEYSHNEIGYNYPLLNILAAVGLAQMEQLDTFLARKKEIDIFYREKFKGNKNIDFQIVRENTTANNWLFTAIFEKKEEIIKILTDKQIQVRPFWQPMNQQKMFRDNIYLKTIDKQGIQKDFSNEIYQKTLSLPCGTQITQENLQEVADLINEI